MPAALTLALFEPDIPQNTGTMLRMCACLGLDAALIEPAAFSIADPRFRRAAMDYLGHVHLTQHASWRAFSEWRAENRARLVLLTTRAPLAYTDLHYAAGDVLLVGREVGRRAGRGARGRRCKRPDSAGAGFALAQCRDRGGDGRWRGAAPNPWRCREAGTLSPSLEARQSDARIWFEALQDRIIGALEALESEAPRRNGANAAPGRFVKKRWQRTDHSGAPGGGGTMATPCRPAL